LSGCNMAAVAFDPLEYAHQLEASGVSRAQAEVHARAMTAMFLHNFDALVTKDYLDVRLTEFETRLETRLEARIDKRIDQRFAELEERFAVRFAEIDRRFAEIDKRFGDIDKRFAEVDQRFAGIDLRLERMEGRFTLLYWMQGLTIACVVIPVIRSFIG